jgi:hypothetical protein
MKFSYDVFQEEGIIEVFNIDLQDTIEIKVDKYWKWVVDNGYHEWCNDFHDPRESDGHGQETGEYSMEEYFMQDYESIKHDLTIYLKKLK